MSGLVRDSIGIIVVLAGAAVAIVLLIGFSIWLSHRSWKKQLKRAQEERDRF